jgi:hypothetical protein
MVNDSIYVFGGSTKEGPIAEKYTLSENRWREVKPKTIQGSDQTFRAIGAASLLYE